MAAERLTPLRVLLGLLVLWIIVAMWPRTSPRKKDREPFLKWLNEFRSDFAKIGNISNMKELEYNVKLEQEIEEILDTDCDQDCSFNRSHPHFYLSSQTVDDAFLQYVNNSKEDKDALKLFFGAANIYQYGLGAEYESVGCVAFFNVCCFPIGNEPYEKFIEQKYIGFRAMCALSPLKRPSPFQFGTPGSMCEKGYEKSGNLCRRT